MSSAEDIPVLLELDAGVRETGWAMFVAEEPRTTGVIGSNARRRMDAEARVAQLVGKLDCLVEEWRPAAVVHSLPSGIHWKVPALDLLNTALLQWSKRHQLTLRPYTAQEVRDAIAGHPNASRDQLAYAVMEQLGLIGQAKTTHEWEALAVGHYHLSRRTGGPGSSPADQGAH